MAESMMAAARLLPVEASHPLSSLAAGGAVSVMAGCGTLAAGSGLAPARPELPAVARSHRSATRESGVGKHGWGGG
jgi:hypothetical protein